MQNWLSNARPLPDNMCSVWLRAYLYLKHNNFHLRMLYCSFEVENDRWQK